MGPSRLLPLIALLSASAAVAPARADNTSATCVFSRHDHTVPVEQGPCTFSQRSASSEGIRFNREGQYTLQVLWRTAQGAIPKPPGWDSDNFFLGRWQGESTAGRAVIDVLTVEPDRIRWGNKANGVCDSDYSVEQLPWGRNGRYPDQLVPPSQPTDLVFGVARLTLQPGPCRTGDGVIQLAMPLDGSRALEVVTYDAGGRLTGQYGAFTPLPSPRP